MRADSGRTLRRCEFYLADYGLARDIAAGADLVQGSPPFLPPEAIPVALGMDMVRHARGRSEPGCRDAAGSRRALQRADCGVPT